MNILNINMVANIHNEARRTYRFLELSLPPFIFWHSSKFPFDFTLRVKNSIFKLFCKEIEYHRLLVTIIWKSFNYYIKFTNIKFIGSWNNNSNLENICHFSYLVPWSSNELLETTEGRKLESRLITRHLGLSI